jgi:hypothetical protein
MFLIDNHDNKTVIKAQPATKFKPCIRRYEFEKPFNMDPMKIFHAGKLLSRFGIQLYDDRPCRHPLGAVKDAPEDVLLDTGAQKHVQDGRIASDNALEIVLNRIPLIGKHRKRNIASARDLDHSTSEPSRKEILNG